jgi:hypothetical protein
MVAQYRLLEKTYLREDDHLEASLHEPGDEIKFSGPPGRHWVPLNDEARLVMPDGPRALDANSKNIWPRRGDPPHPRIENLERGETDGNPIPT